MEIQINDLLVRDIAVHAIDQLAKFVGEQQAADFNKATLAQVIEAALPLVQQWLDAHTRHIRQAEPKQPTTFTTSINQVRKMTDRDIAVLAYKMLAEVALTEPRLAQLRDWLDITDDDANAPEPKREEDEVKE